jgi:hypothetical protein
MRLLCAVNREFVLARTFRRGVMFTAVLILCSAAFAQSKTWGPKPFENDAAMSWLALLKATGSDSIQNALSRVNDEKSGPVTADACSAAIAAASIVAAARDGATELLEPDANAWLQSSAFKPDDKLAKQARTAVATCRGASRSELYMFWMQMTNAPAWIDMVKSLMKRLDN